MCALQGERHSLLELFAPLRLLAPAHRLARGRNTLLHERNEFARDEHIHAVARAAAEDGPGDRVKFGLVAGGDVFLHRALRRLGHRCVEGAERILVDRDPFRGGDRNDLCLSSF